MTSYPCPCCAGDAVLCACDALPEEDQRRLVDALQSEFKDVDHAVSVAIENSEARNLLHVAAFEYVLENGSDDVREAIRSAFQKTFGVKADAYGPNGEAKGISPSRRWPRFWAYPWKRHKKRPYAGWDRML